MAGFLPINAREMRALGWERPDFVYVLGDAYVDHPSFGHAIISRVLERAGYRVAMLPQPDWRDPSSVLEFGEPRLGFLVTGGNMDSMVNHYSVGRHRRRTDAYTPGGPRRASGRTMRRSSTATSSAAAFRRSRSSSAVSRPACAVWRTMITGLTA